MTPKVNPIPCNNPPNLVPNVPADPYSYTSLSYYYLLDSSVSSDNDYPKRGQRTKIRKRKSGVQSVSTTL